MNVAILILVPSFIFGDISNQLKAQYPENSWGGNCVYFVAQAAKTGDLFDVPESVAKWRNRTVGTPEDPVRPGDVIWEFKSDKNLPSHASVISKIFKDKSGKVRYQLTESNWGEDQKIHHDRMIDADDPGITTIYRGQGKQQPEMVVTSVERVPVREAVPKSPAQSSAPRGWAVDDRTGKMIKDPLYPALPPQPAPLPASQSSAPAGWTTDPVTKRLKKL